jgi:hypothetical protein
MEAEPINLFSHKQDVAGIAILLRRLAPGLSIAGPEDDWQRITIQGAGSLLRKAPVLIFKHDREYYSGPEWPMQVAGMQGYFSRFPEVARKPDIMRVIRSFRFALALEFHPDLFLHSNDPRLQFVFAVTRHLDAVMFTPSGLWDAVGRALINGDGESDPNAVLPAIPKPAEQAAAPPTERGEETSGQKEPPPDAPRATKRALCLAAVSVRGLLENDKTTPREETEALRNQVLTWAGELALEQELEPREMKLLQQSIGTLSKQATIDAVWRLEGLGVLLWALGRFQPPPYDQCVHTGSLIKVVGIPGLNQATALLAGPTLRSGEELRKLQKQCFALHWRLRSFSLNRKPMDFPAVARKWPFGPMDVSSARFCNEDLAIGKTSISQAPAEEFRTALSIANERHQCINWLVDGGKVYSETNTGT